MPGVVPGIHVFADADGGSTGTRMAGRASHDDNGENRTKAMKLSDIADNPGSWKERSCVGRGIGSGKFFQAEDGIRDKAT